MEQKGRIHSVESFGTVDGPGVRFVVFFQGCPLRCLYCHNPDSWKINGGMEMTVQELLKEYERNQSFYKNGGLTASGGEPLMQLPFLTELFQRARERGIHTCLDTSGITYRDSRKEQFEKLFSVTSLVLLDIKNSLEEEHEKLTGQSQEPVLAFAKALEEYRIPVVIRHVLVPGITDCEEELMQLGRIIGGLSNVKGLEVLPYHTMGINKYEALGMEYPLKGVPEMDKSRAAEAKEIILKAIREKRRLM